MSGRAVVAVALGVVSIVAQVAATVAMLVAGALPPEFLVITLAVITMASVGALLAIKVPGNPIGWLILVAAFCLALGTLGQAYAGLSFEVARGSLPGTPVAIWLYGNLLVVPVLIMTLGIPLIYPDGHLLSPRWRWFAVALIVTGVASFVWQAFRPGLIPDTNVENPFGIAAIESLQGVIEIPSIVGVTVFLGAVASIVIRYRRGSLVERQQVKWLVAVTALAGTAWSLVIIGESTGASVLTTVGWYGALLAFVGFPVAIGIAILRYRLYEIDRIISRTIAYAVVTGLLVTVFAGSVLLLQSILAPVTDGDTVAVAASTLVAAAMFQPLRGRIQTAVDRRFDRIRYDGERLRAAFGERLREEVDLSTIQADVLTTVDAAVRPSSVGLWLLGRSDGAA